MEFKVLVNGPMDRALAYVLNAAAVVGSLLYLLGGSISELIPLNA